VPAARLQLTQGFQVPSSSDRSSAAHWSRRESPARSPWRQATAVSSARCLHAGAAGQSAAAMHPRPLATACEPARGHARHRPRRPARRRCVLGAVGQRFSGSLSALPMSLPCSDFSYSTECSRSSSLRSRRTCRGPQLPRPARPAARSRPSVWWGSIAPSCRRVDSRRVRAGTRCSVPAGGAVCARAARHAAR